LNHLAATKVADYNLMMNRLHYFIAVGITMLVGLMSRRFTEGGDFIHDYVGDAIWAGMIYLGFRFLQPSKPLKFAIIATLGFCYAIEISQLNQSDWLNQLRSTTLGGLILGFGFLWSDFVMYTLGIFAAAFVDYQLNKVGN
jgi:Protein of unknown function (DUF2809)